jgi:type II secretory ATPase GspE/PulE/Tfp pilus assembly ATPase PilB-like protein
MRRPINWLVFGSSLGFFMLGRAFQAQRPAPIVIDRTQYAPTFAAAVPAALRGHEVLEFGYVERDR